MVILFLLYPFFVKIDNKITKTKQATFRIVPKYIEPLPLSQENVIIFVRRIVPEREEGSRILSIIFHESNYCRSRLAKDNNNIAGLRHRKGIMKHNYLVYAHWQHCVVELIEYEKKYKTRSSFRQKKYIKPLQAIKWKEGQ